MRDLNVTVSGLPIQSIDFFFQLNLPFFCLTLFCPHIHKKVIITHRSCKTWSATVFTQFEEEILKAQTRTWNPIGTPGPLNNELRETST